MSRFCFRAIVTASLLLIASMASAFYEPGDTIADFTLLDVHGNEHSLYDFLGDIIVLNFFTTWCAGCNEEAGHLENDIRLVYSDRGLTVIAVNLAQPPILVDGWAQAMGVEYLILVDPDSAWGLYALFGGLAIPYNAVIDRDMKLRYSQIGFDLAALLGAIDDVLADENSPVERRDWSSVKALFGTP